MDQVLLFIKNYWVAIAVVFFLVAIVSLIMKSIVRFIIFAVVVGFILVFGFNYTPKQAIDTEKNAISSVTDVVEKTIVPIAEQELKGAKTVQHPDGTYEIDTTSVSIIGKKGTDTATLRYNDHDYSVKLSELGTTINQYVNQINH